MQMGLAGGEVSATSSLNPRRRSSSSGVGMRPLEAVEQPNRIGTSRSAGDT